MTIRDLLTSLKKKKDEVVNGVESAGNYVKTQFTKPINPDAMKYAPGQMISLIRDFGANAQKVQPVQGVTNPFSLQNPNANKLGRKVYNSVVDFAQNGIQTNPQVTNPLSLQNPNTNRAGRAVLNAARTMFVGDPAETRTLQQSYRKVSNNQPISVAERNMLEQANKNEMMNFAGTFAGPKAANFKNLPKVTGAFDEVPRAEISDLSSRVKNNFIEIIQKLTKKGETPVLADVMNHDALYKSYPQAKLIKVKLDPEYVAQKVGGSFNPVDNSITVNPTLKRGEFRSALLHEVQHAIQKIEGFARGSDLMSGADKYRNSAGELEARAAQLREGMNSAQRKAVNPYEQILNKEGIKREDVVVNTGGDINLSANGATDKSLEQITQQEADAMSGTAELRTTEKGFAGKFQKLFGDWVGKRRSAELKGIKEAQPYSQVPSKDAWDVVRKIEDPNTPVSKSASSYANSLSSKFDELYNQAKEAGIDINYLKDYITHIWQESPQKVREVYTQYANKNFQFGRERSVPTYEEGIKMGLTPKYTNPAEILATYVKKLEQTKATIEFVKTLKQEGVVVPASVGAGRQGFEPIVTAGFPDSSTVFNSKVVRGQYYAPTEVARKINSAFGEQPDSGLFGKAVGLTGKAASGLQDVTLSGGIPGTPINAFGGAQLLAKEYPSGNIVGPTKSFIRAISDKATRNYFINHSDTVIKMEERQIPLSTNLSIDSFISGNTGSSLWNKTINDPTFKRFMPMMQVDFFENVEKQALKSGVSAEEAADVAAQATKNWYGIKETGKEALTSKLSKDVGKTLFFAPKYRGSMINFWFSSIKGALTHPLALENRQGIRFLVGAGLMYFGMDRANKALTGHSMSENPEGMKDKMLIPYKGGYIGVPFLSSVGTLPRMMLNAGSKMVKGDIVGGTKEIGKTSFSSLAKIAFDIWSNEDYFGNEIYGESQSPEKQNIQIASYILRSTLLAHPWVGTLYDRAAGRTKDDPWAITASKMAEMPFRYYKPGKVESSYYFEQKDKAFGGLSPAALKAYESIQSSKVLDKDGLPVDQKRGEMATAMLKLAYPEIMRAENQAAILTAEKTNEPLNPYYTLTPDQQQVVQLMKTFYPGSKEKSDLTNANISWLQPYWAMQQGYFEELKATGKYTGNEEQDSFAMETLTPDDIRPLQDAYFKLPKGTGARSAFLKRNPKLLEWWDKKAEIVNSQREKLGLTPLASGYSQYQKKPKKAPKFKLAKTKVAKVGPLKLKLASTAKNKVKITEPKRPDLTYKKPGKQISVRDIQKAFQKITG